MNAASLGNIVRSLLLGEVGDVTGHGGGYDEASGPTFFEVMADGFGTVEGTSEVGLDDLGPVLDGAIKYTAAGGATGVGNESIDLEASISELRPSVLQSVDIPFQSP